MSRLRKFLGKLREDSPALLIFGRLLATALSFLTAPIIARAIGPEGRGETAAAIALFNIVPILLAVGIPLEIRRLSANSEAGPFLRIARVYCLVALPVAAAVAFGAYFTLFAQFDESTRIAATIGTTLCPLMMLWTCDLSILIVRGRYRGVMALQLVQPSAYLTFVLIFLLLGRLDPAAVLMANVAGTVAAAATGVALTRISMRGDYYPLVKLVRGGLKYAGSSIAETASSRLDQVLALPLIGAFQAGIYSAAVTVASIPLAVGQALGAAYFPLVARASAEARPELREEATRVAIAAMILCSPLLLVGAWVGIPLLFGPEFNMAIPVSWIAGIGTCAMIVAFVCSMTLAAEGRGVRMTVAQVSSLAVSVVLLLVLGPIYGAAGAAASSSIGYVLLLFLLLAGMNLRPSRIWPMPSDFRQLKLKLFRG